MFILFGNLAFVLPVVQVWRNGPLPSLPKYFRELSRGINRTSKLKGVRLTRGVSLGELFRREVRVLR